METPSATSPLGMACPRCGALSPALEGSGPVIAWYACPVCDTFWSARIRAGQPTDPIPMEPRRTGHEAAA